MAELQDEEVQERLKEALWFSIGKIVDQESLQRNRNATPQFIGALTDMIWHQIGKQSISQHAGRTTVTTDDVLLLARRNQDLYSVIKDVVDREKAAKVKGKDKARG
ncbi:kinetochore component CENP-S-domain-containing protein [Chaetomium sp. MPI-CAGE-AT-0009]|nr:kinetochore component CENP-S-domain-containing protein [Chaetomium sp. MPI-CAGE-AT-0009]